MITMNAIMYEKYFTGSECRDLDQNNVTNKTLEQIRTKCDKMDLEMLNNLSNDLYNYRKHLSNKDLLSINILIKLNKQEIKAIDNVLMIVLNALNRITSDITTIHPI